MRTIIEFPPLLFIVFINTGSGGFSAVAFGRRVVSAQQLQLRSDRKQWGSCLASLHAYSVLLFDKRLQMQGKMRIDFARTMGSTALGGCGQKSSNYGLELKSLDSVVVFIPLWLSSVGVVWLCFQC